MKKSFGLLSVLVLLIGCDTTKKDKAITTMSTDTVTINKSDFDVDEVPENCYLMLSNQDTTFVTINDNLGTITGKIEYTKDSINELIGYAAEDTLKLEMQYSVQADSVISKDMWFLRQYGNLYEGTGKRHHDGTYLHPNFVKYDEGNVYKPIDRKEK